VLTAELEAKKQALEQAERVLDEATRALDEAKDAFNEGTQREAYKCHAQAVQEFQSLKTRLPTTVMRYLILHVRQISEDSIAVDKEFGPLQFYFDENS
jgi:hypothetical protein